MNTGMKTTYSEITDCLKELIETQDFIIIPEFGAFVMQMESAEFSIAQNVLFPPRKKILFNPLLKHNDGLLIATLQKHLGIEVILAQTLVQQFVQSLNVLLETKRRAELEGIGYFYKDLEGNVLFESTLNPFYLSESIGLYPVSTIPVERENIIEENRVPSKVVRLNQKNWYKAAVVLLLVGLIALYWWFSPIDFKTQMANVFGAKPQHRFYVSSKAYPLIKVRYNQLFANELLKQNPAQVEKINENSIASHEINSKTYSIVTGCFRVEENAKKLAQQFKSKKLEAFIKWNPEKQLFVVSIGNFNSKDLAVKNLQELKLKNVLKDGWVKEVE
ncbi:MAG: hypothetical protein KatS3mg027_0064 [Bacteroidia bacterium]|nr:MAG: hypothetical protein KatS3mg027_0064 [Bacteroidia bacterium]